MKACKVIKVGVSHRFLQSAQGVVDSFECSVDIGLPNLEFSLDVCVSELNPVLINELGEQISKFLILSSETISMNLFWSELSTNNVKLISDMAEDWCPSNLVSSVSHDSGNHSILASQIVGELTHNIINRIMHLMTLNEGLEAMSESGPLRNEHASLV